MVGTMFAVASLVPVMSIRFIYGLFARGIEAPISGIDLAILYM